MKNIYDSKSNGNEREQKRVTVTILLLLLLLFFVLGCNWPYLTVVKHVNK
jgi:hypothetical protein